MGERDRNPPTSLALVRVVRGILALPQGNAFVGIKPGVVSGVAGSAGVRQQPLGDVRQALPHDGVLRVVLEADALQRQERAGDVREVRRQAEDVAAAALRQRLEQRFFLPGGGSDPPTHPLAPEIEKNSTSGGVSTRIAPPQEGLSLGNSPTKLKKKNLWPGTRR